MVLFLYWSLPCQTGAPAHGRKKLALSGWKSPFRKAELRWFAMFLVDFEKGLIEILGLCSMPCNWFLFYVCLFLPLFFLFPFLYFSLLFFWDPSSIKKSEATLKVFEFRFKNRLIKHCNKVTSILPQASRDCVWLVSVQELFPQRCV